MTPRSVFLWVGRAEALSFLVLLAVAMPLKYLAGHPEPVRFTGWAHGLLFIGYLVTLARVSLAEGWPATRSGLGVLAAFVPFGPLLLERQLHR